MSYMRPTTHIHFIGIGGIGISAIARMMLLEHTVVTGSDRAASPVTDALRAAGATIHIGHDARHLSPEVAMVIYTIAIPDDNPELAAAKKRGILMYTYPEFLGILSKEKTTIAVSGTHGKTTTTAMIASVLIAAELDPTVVVGSLMKKTDGTYSNFIAGTGTYLVVEACEFKRSFLNLWPEILVITNVDTDHLDYYKDLADIQSAFRELAERVPKTGVIITQTDNAAVAPVLTGVHAPVQNYDEALATVRTITLPVPGAHNESNAACALMVARKLGVADTVSLKTLAAFGGTWRRFEKKGMTQSGVLVYDDYAHHPTEISAALKSARLLFPQQRIVVAFHPHLYSRTRLLFAEFAEALAQADEVVLAPIYAARESHDPTVTAVKLAEAIASRSTPARACETFESIAEYLRSHTGSGDVIITMGAGDIYKVAESLIE